MKKAFIFFIVFSIIMSMGVNSQVGAQPGGEGWYLKEVLFKDGTTSGLSGLLARSGTLNDEYSYSGEKNNMTITHVRHHYNTATNTNEQLVAKSVTNQKWTDPQSFVKEGEQVTIKAESSLIEYVSWKSPHDLTFYGETYNTLRDSAGNTALTEGGKGTFSSKPWPKGAEGRTLVINVGLGDGFGYTYTYEWKDSGSIAAPTLTPTPTPATPASGNSAEAFASGARIMWYPAKGLGYRLFRSTSKSELGISVTDFYITSTSYADVNVEANTTYYYTVKPVLAEAKPFEGIDEKLGDTIATFTITTGAEIYKPGTFKHFIMLKLESPDMSVDGVSQEVDPGRGTMPIVISGRTMVPIRAVVEAMGGTAEWEASTKKITLKARGNVVEMWLGKTDITVNGQAKKMDIAPTSKNDRTFVPVRFAGENLNCKVDWINSTKEAVMVYEE